MKKSFIRGILFCLFLVLIVSIVLGLKVFAIIEIFIIASLVWNLINANKPKNNINETIKMLSNISEYSSECVFLKDLDGKYLACNKNYAKVMHFSSPEELVGRLDSEITSSKVLEETKKAENYVIKNNLPLKYIKPLEFSSDVIFEISFFPFIVNNKAAGVLAVAKNIKERLQLEQYLSDKNAQISSLLDSIGSMVYIKDLKNKIISLNKSFLHFFSCTEADVESNILIKEFILSDKPNLEHEQKIFAKKESIKYDKTFILNGKTYWFEIQKSPLFNAEQNIIGVMHICSDITNRKKTETELRKAKEKADAASRMKSEMIANISHELKTPIGCIMSNTDLLAEQISNPKQLVYIKRTQHFIEILLKLINTLLEFSRLERGKSSLELSEFSLKEALLDSLSAVKNKAEIKNIKLDFDFDRNLPFKVVGDNTKLFQVLSNLLDNAIKFTNEGRVTLKSRLIETDNKNAVIYFEVSDTGIGIEKIMQDKIFDSFVQVDLSARKKYDGAGLGLPICKRILELMDSKIICESALGVGTKMYFTVKFSCTRIIVNN